MTDLIKQEKIEHIERLKMELEELENLKPEPEPEPASHIEDESDDDDAVVEVQKKQTRPRTAKQIEQFKKVVENKMKNAAERKLKAELKADADKQELEH